MKRIELPSSRRSLFASDFPEQGIAPLLADLWTRNHFQATVVFADSLSEAESRCEDLVAFSEALVPERKIDFHLFDEIPRSDHPDGFDRACERLSLLSSLRRLSEADKDANPILVATTFEAALGPCPLLEGMKESEVEVRSGQETSFSWLTEKLAGDLDYSSEAICEEPGQYSVRGGLIDVYPVNANHPARIDFFGDSVEDIRLFDPSTQRTFQRIESLIISSLSEENLALKNGEFLRYLPSSVLWAIHEPESCLHSHPLAFHRSDESSMRGATFADAWEKRSAENDFFLGTSLLDAGAGIFESSPKTSMKISLFVDPLENQGTDATSFLSDGFGKPNSDKLIKRLQTYESSGFGVFIAVGAEMEKKRIREMIAQTIPEPFEPRFIAAGLRDGFVYKRSDAPEYFSSFIKHENCGLVLASSREILGRERSRRPSYTRKARVNKRQVDQALDFSDLIPGDLLVHLQHGICMFDSLGVMQHSEKPEEAITVEFADGILLHVPLQESHLLSRYLGLTKSKPKLAKLGGKAWANTKRAAEMAALDLAADLLRLQATRDAEQGHPFALDEKWQKEFEDAFPYSETPDQLRAIEEVKKDMESNKPMDRLVCGDVGYGKTEVAMRAAFKAIMDGKQVALLAPTTILCQQHLQSFAERMCDYPIRMEMLSRFRSKSSQKKTIEGLKCGAVDLVIGTHRMLGSDLRFKDLGLVIIDEEQRFGVEHKEKLKRLRANVDVLTLSATPIPRTLYFAMVGARAFCAIETPPTNRRPIRTEVALNSPEVIKRAIESETRRGGQVFYLHNRVRTIHATARKLQLQFPKLRIALGHGQMKENELELVMTEFVAGKFDLLVCTTIIESGLDIPNCNTIIIEGADKFGLSQLYQLRGRVGRFTKQAYAYLLVNRAEPIADKAKKRLSAMRSSNSMGAGFRIALRDLELRGAGNLLGSEQSGHVAGIGFEMYCQLLSESVSRLKGEELSLRPSASVRIDFLNEDESCFPVSYLGETRLRIEFYRKLAATREVEEIDSLKEELEDRFGPLPDCVTALLMEAEIRCLAEACGLDLVETKNKEVLCRKVGKNANGTRQYLKIMGMLPKLHESEPFLRLKEIIRFLKLRLHGNNNRS